jgi:hypothetical protein
MKLSKLFSITCLSLSLCFSLVACGGDDEGDTNADMSTTDNNETTGDGDGDAETGPSMNIDCSVFCVTWIDMCAMTGMSTEWATSDECDAACQAWDQDGKNCRYQQIVDGACDQAGDMGTACQ